MCLDRLCKLLSEVLYAEIKQDDSCFWRKLKFMSLTFSYRSFSSFHINIKKKKNSDIVVELISTESEFRALFPSVYIETLCDKVFIMAQGGTNLF